MRRLLALLCLSAALLLSACGDAPDEEAFLLYFAASDSSCHGAAIESQSSSITADTSPEELIGALLSGPSDDHLSSPFPRGVTLRSCSLSDGVLALEFSEHYSGLSDIGITIADYCVVLTLSQLDGIERVEIRTAGYPDSLRSYETLRPEQAFMDVESDTVVGR